METKRDDGTFEDHEQNDKLLTNRHNRRIIVRSASSFKVVEKLMAVLCCV